MASLAPLKFNLNGDFRCVFHISQAPSDIEINDATGVIGAISTIDTNARQWRQWIVICTNGAIDANDVIDSNEAI